jgi:hypothetical protein
VIDATGAWVTTTGATVVTTICDAAGSCTSSRTAITWSVDPQSGVTISGEACHDWGPCEPLPAVTLAQRCGRTATYCVRTTACRVRADQSGADCDVRLRAEATFFCVDPLGAPYESCNRALNYSCRTSPGAPPKDCQDEFGTSEGPLEQTVTRRTAAVVPRPPPGPGDPATRPGAAGELPATLEPPPGPGSPPGPSSPGSPFTGGVDDPLVRVSAPGVPVEARPGTAAARRGSDEAATADAHTAARDSRRARRARSAREARVQGMPFTGFDAVMTLIAGLALILAGTLGRTFVGRP